MAKQPRILAGQTAAITGGARGIGRATAQAFLRQGMRVAIGDVDLQAAQQTAQEIGAPTHPVPTDPAPTHPGATDPVPARQSIVALELDVTDRESFSTFLDGVEQQFGPVDVLVNNAGIMPLGRFIDEDDLTTRRMIDINLHGVILGTKLALARMVPRDRGHIVNIASQAGKFGAPGGATYSATKHAVVGLTEAVRGELRLMGAHIDLSYVMPFVVNTELGSGLAQARGLHNLEPFEVADAIVEALQQGTVEVWVPKSTKRTYQLSTLLPRTLAEGLGRAMKANRVLADADATVRRDYELRAARSEPGLPPASEPAQIPERAAK
jgi:NAD(P)-dependent dehydrogenase (short-subunit alcohol dehydrogenase family)